MAENISEITAIDVAIDIAGQLDGFSIEDYFEDHGEISYEAPALTPSRSTRFDLVAEDPAGNKKTFRISVSES